MAHPAVEAGRPTDGVAARPLGDPLILLTSGLAFVLLLVRYRHFIHDDAYISLRYARNLAEHGQIVWNLGERVEGYTNFLFVLMTAAPIALGVDPVVAARSICAAAALAILCACARGIEDLRPCKRDGTGVLVGIAVAVTPGLALWTVGGLETVVLAAFLAWASVIALRSTVATAGLLWSAGAGLLLALATLTRPDALVFAAALALGVVAAGAATLPRRAAAAGMLVATPLAAFAAHALWRHGYYGEWLPLTYYAKADLDLSIRLYSGAKYLALCVQRAPIVFIALAAAALAFLRRPSRGPLIVLAAPVGGYAAYVGWAGGDHMEGARLLVPVLAPAGLLFLVAIAPWPRRLRIAAAAGLALASAAAAAGVSVRTDAAAFVGRVIGRRLAEELPPGTVIALHTAGSTPYFADDNVYIDMLGLNDPHIARRQDLPILLDWQRVPGHAKGDGAYVLRRRPDIVILGVAEGSALGEPVFLSDAELAALPEFRRCYRPAERRIPLTEADLANDPQYPDPITFRYYARVCAD